MHHAGIFDGHRGSRAADFAAEHIQEHLLHQWNAESAASALQAAFLSLDAAFKYSQVQSSHTQTSALCCS
jgi:serine/threonine protein phosphatase PrpC